MLLEPGTVVDRYRVEALLGEGGMARVYRVRHVQLGSLHALKVLANPHPRIRDRLMQEGRVQARLRHPNVVSVTDVILHDGAPGLVMEYVRGPSLGELLRKRRLSLDQADWLALGILRGVAAAHAHGLAHRDLKPGNVLLSITADGLVPKVADFGLVKILEGEARVDATRSGIAMGTPAYMAPEQIQDASSADQRADVFSLGAILYELVAGRKCFEGATVFDVFRRIGAGEYLPLRDVAPEAPERMEQAIRGALHVDRDQRVQEVAHLVSLWKGETSLSNDSLPPPNRPAGPFDASFMADVDSLGSGGEEDPIAPVPDPVHATPATRDFDLEGLVVAPVVVEETRSASHTVVPDPPTPPPTTPTMVPDGLASLADPPPTATTALPLPPPPPPPPPSRAILWVGAGLAALGGGALGLALVVALGGGRPDPPPEPVPEPAPAAAPVPDVAPAPAPVPAPPEPEPDKRKVRTTPPPRPAPAPEPAPASPTGSVRATGDADRVYVKRDGRMTLLPADVAPGAYEILAVFGDKTLSVGRLEVVSGGSHAVKCQRMMQWCMVEG